MKAYLILETGEAFSGEWHGGEEKAGEVVFNTSHSGYEEMSTDPSYYSQILVTTAPMQGNYSATDKVWESEKMWIHGFVCLEVQKSQRDQSWLKQLTDNKVPLMSEVDTRKLVLLLRERGTTWGALVNSSDEAEAKEKAKKLIEKEKLKGKDWVHAVCTQTEIDVEGDKPSGPRVAVIDFGAKKNIVRELKQRCSAIRVFPSRAKAEDIRKWEPHGVMLSNGPGDPADVEQAVETVKSLLGWRFIFGICMGHQILSLALGAKTYRLKFGHRGSNHPIKDSLLDKIYVTSQNHGYAVEQESLPSSIEVTHINLNDNTVSGIRSAEHKCLSVQFHPESRPGPHDAEVLFDYFIKQIQ